jgi:hypothetical protein
MGWNIALIENTAKVPLDKREEVARFMVDRCADAYGGRASKVYDDEYAATAPAHKVLGLVFGYVNRPDEPPPQTIYFDNDNMEHMDFLTHDDTACAFLAAAGTTGRILFCSMEGDNKGAFWGVEFASGHYRSMTASLASLNWTAGTSRKG